VAHAGPERRERDGTKGGHTENPRNQGGREESFRVKGTPRRAGPPAGGGQFAAPFFLIRLSFPPRFSRSSSPFSFSFITPNYRSREFSLFSCFPFFCRFFISRLPLLFCFPLLFSVTLEASFFVRSSSAKDFIYADNFFSNEMSDVIAPRAMQVEIDKILYFSLSLFPSLETDQVNFLARLSCVYR